MITNMLEEKKYDLKKEERQTLSYILKRLPDCLYNFRSPADLIREYSNYIKSLEFERSIIDEIKVLADFYNLDDEYNQIIEKFEPAENFNINNLIALNEDLQNAFIYIQVLDEIIDLTRKNFVSRVLYSTSSMGYMPSIVDLNEKRKDGLVNSLRNNLLIDLSKIDSVRSK